VRKKQASNLLLTPKKVVMKWIEILFGHGTELSSIQMSCRAIVAFFIALILLRIAGIRTFGKKSAFDNVIVIMLGSILSRAVVGASPFIATSVACLVFALIHWLLAKVSCHVEFIGKLIKGQNSVLYEKGEQNEKNMKKTNISHQDLMEEIRLQLNQDNLKEISKILIERNGQVSIVKEQRP
jgi:uncharacterized membrane protein YcaP (DUF421 family)